jgi:hypothetical protein
MTIEALRPETADLLRRHVESLRQELRQDGLGAVSISIGGGEAGRGSGTPAERGGPGRFASLGGTGDGTTVVPVFPSPPRPRPAAGQLDLRV